MKEIDFVIKNWREQYIKSVKINRIALYTAIFAEVMCLLNVAIQDDVVRLVLFTAGAVLNAYLIARAVTRLLELYQHNIEIELSYQYSEFLHSLYSEKKTEL